jgi:acyl carrier protein
MTEQELLGTLSRILGDLLGNNNIALAIDTTRDQVPNWDSFTYVNFIVGVEAELGIRFGVAEVESFESVGAIVRRAMQLLGASSSRRLEP